MHEDHGRHSPAERAHASGWTWRHVLTVLLLAVTMPVFLIAAAVAAVVAAPLLIVYGVAQGVRSFRGPAPAPRRLLLR